MAILVELPLPIERKHARFGYAERHAMEHERLRRLLCAKPDGTSLTEIWVIKVQAADSMVHLGRRRFS